MLLFPNYRISLKKNISQKTLTSFPSLKNVKPDLNNKNNLKLTLKEKPSKVKSKYNIASALTKNSLFTQKLFTQHCHQTKPQSPQLKTFIFDSSDAYIKKILLSQNWKKLPSSSLYESNSLSPTLKWLTIAKNQNFSNLQKHQLINHFKDSYKLTTKIGLHDLLKNQNNQILVNKPTVNCLNVCPRSYNISTQFEQFKRDFQHTAVLNLMKKIMIHIQIGYQKSLYQKYKNISSKQKCLHQDREQLKMKIEHMIKRQNLIFQNDDSFQSYQDQRQESNTSIKYNKNQRILINRTIFTILLNYFYCYIEGNSISSSKLKRLIQYSKLNPPYKNISDHFDSNQEISFLTHQSGILFFNLYYFCLHEFPYFINDGLNNIWIVKANEGSRGRNIFLINQLQQLVPYQNGGNRLIQKYIQNVWILNENRAQDISSNSQFKHQQAKIQRIFNRKFDIRFWVLVKSFVPLDAYIFSQGYLRLSSENYNLDQKQFLSNNLKTHLTNYSLNYKSNHKQNKKNGSDEDEDSYLLFSDFIAHLNSAKVGHNEYNEFDEKHQRGFDSVLFKKVKQKIMYVLQSASNNWRTSQTDKNSFQLFGFDIILDNNLQPYILQCNMSPACHQRGQLKQILRQMGQGLLQIVNVLPAQQSSQRQIATNELKNENHMIGNCKWLRLIPQEQQLTSSKRKKLNIKKYSLSQTKVLQKKHNFTINMNKKPFSYPCGQLQIIGQRFNKHILDNIFIDCLDKIIILQQFFTNRYKDCNTKVKRKSSLQFPTISKACLMIQKLSHISKVHKKIWVKKMLKYTKRYLKKNNL